MIIIVEGKLGSGKTYYAVNYMIKKYFKFDEEILDFVAKKDVKIVSNIDSLVLPHINLDDEIERLGKGGVFSLDYVRNEKGYNFVYIIDEAQHYFSRKYFDKDVFKFFQMSRHEGVDILLITQDRYTLSRELQNLSERSIFASQRSVRSKNTFVYKTKIDDDVVGMSYLRFDKRIANLYRSQEKDEIEKVSYAGKKYIYFACAMLVCCVLGFIMFINFWKAQAVAKNRNIERAKVHVPNKYIESVEGVVEKKEVLKDGSKEVEKKGTEVKNVAYDWVKKYERKDLVKEENEKSADRVDLGKYPNTEIRKKGNIIELVEEGRVAGVIRIHEN